jgi:hypothetical protein
MSTQANTRFSGVGRIAPAPQATVLRATKLGLQSGASSKKRIGNPFRHVATRILPLTLSSACRPAASVFIGKRGYLRLYLLQQHKCEKYDNEGAVKERCLST